MKKYWDIGLKILFFVYLSALVWIIIFKLQFSVDNIDRVRSINLMPFKGATIVNHEIDISEIVNNVIIFVPFGIYMKMLKTDGTFFKNILTFLCVSLLFEIVQYAFAIGRSDITDIIENTLGGCIGVFVYNIFLWIFKEKVNKIFGILASIGTIFMLLLLIVTILLNY